MTKQQTQIFNDECRKILHAQADATRYELLKESHIPGFPQTEPPISLAERSLSIPREFLQLLHGRLVPHEEIVSLYNSLSVSALLEANNQIVGTRFNDIGNINSIWLFRQLTTVCFEQAESSFQIIKNEIDSINELQERIKCYEKVKGQWWRMSSTKKEAQDQISLLTNKLNSYPSLETLRENVKQPLYMLQNLAYFTNYFLEQQVNELNIQQIEPNLSNLQTFASLTQKQKETTGSYEFREKFPPIITAKTSNAICCAMHNSMRKAFIERGLLEEINPFFSKLPKTKIDVANTPDCVFSSSNCSTICKTIMERKREIKNENKDAEFYQLAILNQSDTHCANTCPHFEPGLDFPVFPTHSFVYGRTSDSQNTLSSVGHQYVFDLQKLNNEHEEQIKPTIFQRFMQFFSR